MPQLAWGFDLQEVVMPQTAPESTSPEVPGGRHASACPGILSPGGRHTSAFLGDLHPDLGMTGSQVATVLGSISFRKTHP